MASICLGLNVIIQAPPIWWWRPGGRMSQSISSNDLAFIIPGSPAESYMTWKFQDSRMISEDEAEYLWYMLKFETLHSLRKCH